MKHQKKYENVILILILFIIASVLLSSNSRRGQLHGILVNTTLAVVTPIQKGVTNSVRNIVSIWYQYLYLINASKENKVLKHSMMEQKFHNQLLLEELKKYRRVENLLALHSIARSNFQIAGVVGWDSTNIVQTLVIDRGTRSGIKEGMIALTHEGLVGRIVDTFKHASKVLLLTDARSAVDAYFQDSRVRCIVVGQNRNTCIIRYLPIDADVKEGDVLISSGLGGIYPKGLTLGRITRIERGNDRLFYNAEMKPSADLKRMEELLVMLTPPPSRQKSDAE
ncbi:MAG: cell shape-determining protein MreC [bacterium]|nr:MAG: cell shape-determining protein MreC [bacterium]